jgi:predicted transcriptional regulator/DNA-binding XRE family transcriptional regulator
MTVTAQQSRTRLPRVASNPSSSTSGLDALMVGRRIRQLRTAAGLTLEDLGTAVGRAPSQLSMVENGKQEPRLTLLQAIATALGVALPDLLTAQPLSRRAELEVAVERLQRDGLLSALGLRQIKVSKSVPMDVLELIVGLHSEIQRLVAEKAATPEEARRANAELRQTMRARDNYFEELEQTARRLLAAVGHTGGPLSQRIAADIAAHLGFTLHYVPDLPHSTRSVTDLKHRRIYLPHALSAAHDPRSPLLHAVAGHLLGHGEPSDYGDFLRQRVETNYLAAAMMVPEQHAVELLTQAKASRQISLEDLRDAFGVSYETAAHRFTNLATRHLGIPVHFMKVHDDGTIAKAYENDGLRFSADALGAIEGQPVCRNWAARMVFSVSDRFSPYYQYTDTVSGTYWCTARALASDEGEFSVSVGVPYPHVKWFRGRETTLRTRSQCPDESCCRQPPAELAARWAAYSWPSARPHNSMLAALPYGAFPGVDSTQVYTFLDRHAPR